ncbi:hypothetical protein PGT21_019742 [Puccinia graminis f. sp. tritici]|uniref:Uncharacterized protein n=1 Tax=Puccinia graminis f. sp. tritici TaxID=56615 RepID=A0A5B0R198_PUCGR|nr:hypothetical protein PGT21_019742 [Puccinia graminis f. sp. tritici]
MHPVTALSQGLAEEISLGRRRPGEEDSPPGPTVGWDTPRICIGWRCAVPVPESLVRTPSTEYADGQSLASGATSMLGYCEFRL